MTTAAEGVKVLRRWPGSVEILLEDFERMEALIADLHDAQAAEIAALRKRLLLSDGERPKTYESTSDRAAADRAKWAEELRHLNIPDFLKDGDKS